MPKMRFSPLLVLPAMFVWCVGCGGTFPNGVSVQTNPTTIPLAERHYEFVERGLQGKVCQVKVLGLGIGDSSYGRALDELRAQVPEEFKDRYQFVNVFVDKSFEFYLLAHRVCTIVTADIVALGDYVVAEQPPGGTPVVGSAPQDAPPQDVPPVVSSPEGEPMQAEPPQGEASVPQDPYQEDQQALEDITESRKTYKGRCRKGDGEACEKLALMWQNGLGGRRRVTKAVVFHKKACDLDVAASCSYMGEVLSRKDPEGAARYYEKACELGETEHCKTE